MHFKSLEMRGFKSFVDETKLEFGPGITAVVGPNGCGKSNIADAIRWVLGEQSARYMRGTKMEDLIFNGSGGRKPTGFAEVSITISNEDKSITTHPYSEYEDITVTRKVYRSGESEYFINKVSCRLKDIVDIFLDTGISARSFSIIEQGQIDRIINSKPEDRRFIIEEAAGVMKYKKRRNAALNKLEASQQNLLRVQDIIGELERQRNSLKRQAKKAERYGSMRAEIKNRALFFYSMEYQDHVERQREANDDLERKKESEAAISATLSAKRNGMEVLNNNISKVEKDLADLREERYEVESSIERNDQHRDLLARQLDELSSSNNQAKEEIVQIEEDIVRADDLIDGRGKEIGDLHREIEENESRINAIRREADTGKENLNRRLEDLKTVSGESKECMERINSMVNDQSSLKARLEMSGAKISGVEQSARETEERLRQLEQSLERLKAEACEVKADAGKERSVNDDIRATLKTDGAALSEVESSLRAVEDEITKKKSKLESLQELEKNLEGFGAGVRSIIRMKEEGDDTLGVRGLLAEGVKTTEKLELALEAVLGERLKALIVDHSGQSLKAIEMLKRDNLGRTSFVSEDLAPHHSQANSNGFGGVILGRASEMIELSADVPRSIVATLQSTLVARDLEGALETWKENPGSFTIVTLAGDVIDSAGVITGGGNTASAGAHIMARKRLINELEAEIAELSLKRSDLQNKKAGLDEQIKTGQERLNVSDDKLKILGIKIAELEKEIQKEGEGLARNHTLIESLNKERVSSIEEKERLCDEETVLADGVARLKIRRDKFEEVKHALEKDIDSLRQNLDEITSRSREEEVALAELRGRFDNLKMDVERLNSGKADLVTRLGRLKSSISSFSRRRDEMLASTDAMAEENTGLARKKDVLSSQVNELNDVLEEKLDEKTVIEDAIKELTFGADEARSNVSDLSLRVSELKMRVENIIEKADQEFNLPVDDLEVTDVSDIDPEEVKQRLAFLREQLAKIGDVNMGALEEFEEVNNRYEFLKTQHADLVKSIATLRRTIDSINTTTNKMFDETYKVVSKNFEDMFKRLFGGGRAEMRLVEIEGKTEPGLEIFAQPPGKKIQNLNLLSAGEKAMTALALLFAVFTVKPSPFCLLDEVDAPLDEANIFRFRDMLMEMREKTQFIMITHSQKTMSFADRLYGITQEERGISKILAVNFVDNRHKDFTLTAA